MSRLFLNPQVRDRLAEAAPSQAARRFHSRLPGYRPTPLVPARNLAAATGVARVFIKDESRRFDLPAFKILGAAWAIYLALLQRLGATPADELSLSRLREKIAPLGPFRLLAATDGNHGRAVARVAKWLGLRAGIFIPENIGPSRAATIRSEGAEVRRIAGSYEEAIRQAQAALHQGDMLIQDTAWPGYENVPRWIVDGYATIFQECDEDMRAAKIGRIDAVLVQIGVGSLAAAVIRHFKAAARTATPCIIGVEPEQAACALAALQADRMVEVPGPHRSIMAGLNCGKVSTLAWPLLRHGLNAAMTVPDQRAAEAMALLRKDGIDAGATGAAGAAGLIELLAGENAELARNKLGLSRRATVLLLCTEGRDAAQLPGSS